MKPKVFVGSSVEGLTAAYAIQQNLTFDADVTVWDQGVFELSKTTIESLVEILGKSDFGIFVFSQDDILKIRNVETTAVRDNVLFEFGLFIGKLNRDRVFFVTPSNTDLHLPTDLLGVTPGKYDPNRDDKSLQAAMGPVCHQIRNQIQKLGLINPSSETSNIPETKEAVSDPRNKWTDFFLDRKYDEAKVILEKQIATAGNETEKMQDIVWLAYCDFKLNEVKGVKILEKLLQENESSILVNENIAQIYFWEDYFDRAIEILKKAIPLFNNDPALVKILSDCYKKTEGDQVALDYLLSMSPEVNIEFATEIYTIYYNQKDYTKAREIIHKVYLNYPNNETIRYNYAKVALELDLKEIALYFLRALVGEFPENYVYGGYLSNAYLNLDLYDRALEACKKANLDAKESEDWIFANIGNIFKNKGFYSEGIFYLEKCLSLNKSSQYAHNRLASSIKFKDDEIEKSNAFFEEGRKQLRQFKPTGI